MTDDMDVDDELEEIGQLINQAYVALDRVIAHEEDVRPLGASTLKASADGLTATHDNIQNYREERFEDDEG